MRILLVLNSDNDGLQLSDHFIGPVSWGDQLMVNEVQQLLSIILSRLRNILKYDVDSV